MTTTDRTSYEEFRHLFVKGIERTLAMAQELVREELPSEVSFFLAGSQMSHKLDDIDGILSSLYRSGAFPRIVDLAVCGIRGNETVLWVRPSAHPLTTDLRETWNQPSGTGPFKALGLGVPAYLWDRERPFRLSDLEEALTAIGSPENTKDSDDERRK